jgi:hypothetical protein
MTTIKDLPVGQPDGRTQETEVDKIEKEILDAIKETGITQIERGLLDDMRISYLVMTAQLLGLRQGRDETLKQCQTIEDEKIKDLDIKLQAEIYNNSVLIDNYKEKIISIIEGLRCYGVRLNSYTEVWCIDKNELKRQLNPAQTKE